VSEQGVIWYSERYNSVESRVGSRIFQAHLPDLRTRTTVDDSGTIKQFDLGNTEAWAVNLWNEVFRRKGMTETNAIGTNWEQHQGTSMEFVSTAEEGVVWTIDEEHDVWVLKAGEITEEETTTDMDDWKQIGNETEKFIYIDAGFDGHLVALKEDGNVLYRTGISNADPEGTGW